MKNPDFFDNLPYGMFLIDNNGIIISVNKAASEILNAPPGFFINKAICDSSMKFADKSGNPLTIESNPATITRRTRSRVDKQILSYENGDHGIKKWLEVTAAPINKTDDLSQYDVLFTFFDITDIFEREERYNTIFEQNPFLMVLNDYDTNRYIDVNQKFLAITGINKESSIGKTPSELGLSPDPVAEKLLRDAILSGNGLQRIESTRSVNGIEYTFLFWSQVFGVLGKKYVLSAFQDISDRKLVEKDLAASEAKYKKLAEQLTESRIQLRALTAHIQNVREEERIFIAREIHDELGHLLTVVKLDLEDCRMSASSGDVKLIDKIEPMIELVNSCITSVRKISTELRPGILDHFGLIPALEWHIQQFQIHTKILCTSFFEKESLDLGKQESSTIFRIIQEIFTNITRHSKAGKVNVRMTSTEGHIVINIKDNGVGFDPDRNTGKISFGILGMKERALSIGAEFNIISAPGKGTEISLILSPDDNRSGNHL